MELGTAGRIPKKSNTVPSRSHHITANMPRAEAGSAKAVGNAIKARGLTKLRFYCQICQKANRDEHAYKLHCESESHMRQLSVVAQNPKKAIDDFSRQFLEEFVSLLRRRFGTARIKANQVYQEYIQERHHLHMNATRWVTLTEFVKHLGREGIVHAEDSEKGWFISWIDNSPAALKRQAALQKMERQKTDDEGRQRKYLEEQIAKARSQDSDRVERSEEEAVLKRDVLTGPIKLGISLKPLKSPNGVPSGSPARAGEQKLLSSAAASSELALTPFRMGFNPLRSDVNPLKSASNPLKSQKSLPPSSNPLNPSAIQPGSSEKSTSPTAAQGPTSHQQQPRTMAERIILEEAAQRGKRRSGPSLATSSQLGVKRIRM